MEKFTFTLLLTLLISFLNAFALSNQECFDIAGERYGVDPTLLQAIAIQESSLNPNAINKNKNRTYDIGIMQINSFWIPILKEYGIKEKDLADPCQNIVVGAWILSRCLSIFGKTWKAVDCYNKGPKRAKEYSKYTLKVFEIRKKILSQKFLP